MSWSVISFVPLPTVMSDSIPKLPPCSPTLGAGTLRRWSVDVNISLNLILFADDIPGNVCFLVGGGVGGGVCNGVCGVCGDIICGGVCVDVCITVCIGVGGVSGVFDGVFDGFLLRLDVPFVVFVSLFSSFLSELVVEYDTML